MKVFVFGSSGLVGAACVRALTRRGHAVHAFYGERRPDFASAAAVRSLDLTDREAVERLVLEEWPDAVINAAAVSNPAAVKSAPQRARQLNVDFPAQLALLARHLGSRFIHFSSDMVFDGQSGNYRSTDPPRPLQDYGKLKLEAEEKVLANHPFDPVVLRITLVNGNSPSGHRSVHEKLLHAIAAGERPRLFTDELRQPCSADNVAEVARELVERRDLSGIFHWAGSEPVSRYDLGRAILRRFGLKEDCLEATQLPQHNDEVIRPRNLTLELRPLSGKLRTTPASLEQQMDELQPPASLYRWLRQHGRT